MQIGRLDDKITVEELVKISDGMGGYDDEWSVVGTIWARVMPARGGEEVINDVERDAVGYDVVVRNVGVGAQITERHRIVFEGETMKVERAPVVNRDHYRTLRTLSGVNA